jgi:hypothetical protein
MSSIPRRSCTRNSAVARWLADGRTALMLVNVLVVCAGSAVATGCVAVV